MRGDHTQLRPRNISMAGAGSRGLQHASSPPDQGGLLCSATFSQWLYLCHSEDRVSQALQQGQAGTSFFCLFVSVFVFVFATLQLGVQPHKPASHISACGCGREGTAADTGASGLQPALNACPLHVTLGHRCPWSPNPVAWPALQSSVPLHRLRDHIMGHPASRPYHHSHCSPL